jgi:AcrR family transcriptional regulator
MNVASLSTFWRTHPVVNDITDLEAKLRNVPIQARSRERLLRVLDSADRVLADEGAGALTTTRIAEAAGIPVGSVYRYFPDKQAIVEALALRYWSDFEDLVAGLADADARHPLDQPVASILQALAAGFRARPGFRELWYGGLRTEQVREVTRPTRTAIARSVQRILATHWPDASHADRDTAAGMVVLTGDGLLREAFRLDPNGDAQLLAESEAVLDAYLVARLA